MAEGLRPCPLCGSSSIEIKYGEGKLEDNGKIRCCYCGLTYGFIDSGHEEWAIDCWNHRAEYCMYCGALVGAVSKCPECGMNINVRR